MSTDARAVSTSTISTHIEIFFLAPLLFKKETDVGGWEKRRESGEEENWTQEQKWTAEGKWAE